MTDGERRLAAWNQRRVQLTARAEDIYPTKRRIVVPIDEAKRRIYERLGLELPDRT